MGSVLDKVRKLKASRPAGGGGRVSGIFLKFENGDNVVRLAGEFLEVRTHFIAPSTGAGRQSRGVCIPTAFQGDEKLNQTINCLDWDIEKEEVRKVKTCPVCKLRVIARKILKQSDITEDEKKFYEELARDCASVTKLKWNVIDRKDPYVVQNDGKQDVKVLGYKIATIGMEAWADINGIFEQCAPLDITDPDEGIDICIVKGHNGVRTAYSAKAVIDGRSLKVTPLTEEERALRPHDLKVISGKDIEIAKLMDAMHEDLRASLEANEGVVDDEETAEAPVVEDIEETPPVAKPAPVAQAARPVAAAPKPAAPVAPKPAAPVAAPRVPSAMPQRPVAKAPVAAPRPVVKPAQAAPSPEETEAIGDALSSDEDGLGEVAAQKKT